jgi:hypothetical protein
MPPNSQSSRVSPGLLYPSKAEAILVFLIFFVVVLFELRIPCYANVLP